MTTQNHSTVNRLIQPPIQQVGDLHVLQAEKHNLDNGIPVFMINAGMQDLVKVEIQFNSPVNTPGKFLLPIAVSRMLAEGTSRHNAQEIADLFDYYGAFYGTDETPDTNSIYLFSLNKHLANLLPTLHEVLTSPEFPEKELFIFIQNNRQRLSIAEEKVSVLARNAFHEMLFGVRHPYGHHSTVHEYEALNREEMQAFHRLHYANANFEIILSGKVGTDTLKLVNQQFGDLSFSRTSIREEFPQAEECKVRKQRINKENTIQSAIRVGRRIINRTHPDYPGLAVLNCILGGYFGSRLMSNIREDKGYTYGIGSGVTSMRNAGYFFISTEVGGAVTEDALREIYYEIKRLREEEVPQEELEIVKNYLLGNFLKGIDSAFHLADRFKSIHLHGLGYDYFRHYIQTIRTISPKEIIVLANRYFQEDDLLEMVVGPN